MTNRYQKEENPMRDLARELVSAKYHHTILSSKMEKVFKGEIQSFPCVIIEPIKRLVDLREESLAKKEARRIVRFIEDAKLPMLNKFPLIQQRIEVMSLNDTAVNELIGQIKAEIITLDEKAAEKAKKS